jgi:HK97 family phage portal protein
LATIWQNIASVFIRPEQRGVNLNNPNTPLTPENISGYMTGKTTSGVSVDADSALSLSAVWRAVDVISSTMAQLPIEIIRETANGGQKIAKNHPLYYIISESPNDSASRYDFMQALVANAVMTGNGYAYIERPMRIAAPTALHNIDPVRVTQYIDQEGKVIYRVDGFKDVAARDMIHIKGLTWNGISGVDLIRHHAENFGLALANRSYGANFYNNGAHLSGILKHPTKLSKEAHDRLRASWRQSYGGSSNTGNTAILEEGMDFVKVGLDPVTAQFLETGRKTIADISRIFGVPQFLLEDLDRATFNNIEQLTLLFVRHTILPWCERIKGELNRKLFEGAERGRYKVRFILASLLQGDTQSRAEFYSKLFNIGAFSPNDIRRMEGLNPVEGGDKYFVQINMGNIADPDTGDTPDNGGDSVPDTNTQPDASTQ